MKDRLFALSPEEQLDWNVVWGRAVSTMKAVKTEELLLARQKEVEKIYKDFLEDLKRDLNEDALKYFKTNCEPKLKPICDKFIGNDVELNAYLERKEGEKMPDKAKIIERLKAFVKTSPEFKGIIKQAEDRIKWFDFIPHLIDTLKENIEVTPLSQTTPEEKTEM